MNASTGDANPSLTYEEEPIQYQDASLYRVAMPSNREQPCNGSVSLS
jgi:hypothetical protein